MNENMNVNFFATVDLLDEKVQSGEITGIVMWPIEGECEILEVSTTYKNGNPFVAYRMRHPEKGNQVFMNRLSGENDKDSAKFMGMQRLYSCLFTIAGATPGKVQPSKAFEMANAKLAAGPLRAKYILQEYDSFSEKSGKTFTNQSLESLAVIIEKDFV